MDISDLPNSTVQYCVLKGTVQSSGHPCVVSTASVRNPTDFESTQTRQRACKTLSTCGLRDSPPVRASTCDTRAPYVPYVSSTCEYGLLTVKLQSYRDPVSRSLVEARPSTGQAPRSLVANTSKALVTTRRFRAEAVLTTHGCPTFAHVFARRQHAEGRTAGCDRGSGELGTS
ncbi:hypothetical protein Bbelb_239990 [Branchiostoma belcheri]|nr:hypothetical protein Bbelb_239990 [Branchiostoma belcheri]